MAVALVGQVLHLQLMDTRGVAEVAVAPQGQILTTGALAGVVVHLLVARLYSVVTVVLVTAQAWGWLGLPLGAAAAQGLALI